MATMQGTDATTGKPLDGIAHLRQSVQDILRTRRGTRVMLREYGSNLPARIDAPMNRDTLLDIYADTADALNKWEPRLRIDQVKVVTASPGRLVLDLVGVYLPDGKPITLDGIEIT